MKKNGKNLTYDGLRELCLQVKSDNNSYLDGDNGAVTSYSYDWEWNKIIEGLTGVDEKAVEILIENGYSNSIDLIKKPSVELLKFSIANGKCSYLDGYRHLTTEDRESVLSFVVDQKPHNLFKVTRNPSESILLSLVSKDPRNIRNIPSPIPVSVQLLAVTKNTDALYYIPSEDVHDEVYLYVLDNSTTMPSSLIDWMNLSEKNQLLVANKFPGMLHEMKHPSERVLLVALNKWPLELMNITDSTEEQQIAAVTGILCPDTSRSPEDRTPVGWLRKACSVQGIKMPKLTINAQKASYEKYPESLVYLEDKDVISGVLVRGAGTASNSGKMSLF